MSRRYIDEHDSHVAEQLLLADPVLVTSWATVVEVRETVCRAAARLGEELGDRSLDAIHLASAQRLLTPELMFITFDLRQAQAARSLGLRVLGS